MPPCPGGHQAAYPCPNGNISNEEPTPNAEKSTHSGWKTAYLVRVAVLQLVEKFGLENVGMYTFTFAEDLDFKEASRRWNSFNTRVLSKRYDGHWIKTLELTKRGRPHFHWIGHVPGIRVGCVMGAVARKSRSGGILATTGGIPGAGASPVKLHVQCSGPVLAEERHFFASELRKYGFGTWNDISPIKADDPARAAQYAAKYVVKTFGNRPESLKGARLVSFGKGVKPGTTRFSSIGGRAGLFRESVALYCLKHGCAWEDLPILCDASHGKPGGKYVGHRWAYLMRSDFEKVWAEFAREQPF
jgi:hypothetical protein